MQESKTAISTTKWIEEFSSKVTDDIENMECAVRCTQDGTCKGNIDDSQMLLNLHLSGFVTSDSKCYLIDKALIIADDFEDNNSTKSTYYEKVALS